MMYRKMHAAPMAHPCKHGGLFPYILAIPVAMVTSAMVGVLLTKKIADHLEVMALTKALHGMEDRLSDIERAELEARIRAKLFPA